MRKFRIISEPYRLDRFSPTIPTHRRIRGDESVQRGVTVVEATDVITALTQAIELREHRKHSITSIEEIFPAEALSFTDEQIAAALQQGSEPGQDTLDPADFEGNLYEGIGFNDTVESVAGILGNTLLPGLFMTVAEDMDGANAIIHVRDQATGDYRATTRDMDRMINDRSAEGWDGVISIARALIDTAWPLL